MILILGIPALMLYGPHNAKVLVGVTAFLWACVWAAGSLGAYLGERRWR